MAAKALYVLSGSHNKGDQKPAVCVKTGQLAPVPGSDKSCCVFSSLRIHLPHQPSLSKNPNPFMIHPKKGTFPKDIYIERRAWRWASLVNVPFIGSILSPMQKCPLILMAFQRRIKPWLSKTSRGRSTPLLVLVFNSLIF